MHDALASISRWSGQGLWIEKDLIGRWAIYLSSQPKPLRVAREEDVANEVRNDQFNVLRLPVDLARFTRAALSWKRALTRFSLARATAESPLVSSK